MNKSVRALLLKKVAKVISATAVMACGATSYFDCYQPKEPHKATFEALAHGDDWKEYEDGCEK